jgi:hypothetical protein
MTSSDDSLAVLKSAVLYLYRVGGPILMLIATIGSLLNLLVFTHKNLRKNPCSIYFIAYNLVNPLYICSLFLFTTLNVGYQINPSGYNLRFCRVRLYLSILSNCLSPFYLILAAIDRILITSSNALTRQKSTRRLAYLCLGGGTLFWALFHSYILIVANIIQLGPNIFQCNIERGVSLAFFSYYLIMKELLALSLMIFCELWAIKNIRSTRRVAVARAFSVNRTTGDVINNLQSSLSKDRQLIIMLFMDITIYTLFSFMYAISLIYEQITQNYMKSYDRIQIEDIVQYICLYSIAIPFCISCYANLIVSKTYRKEVKKLFS